MAQLCFVLACVLWTGRFGLGDGQGDGTQLEGNRGSFVCQQRCADLDGEGVREIRDDTLFVGNHMESCICQQSCSGEGGNNSREIGQLKNMMQAMASSLESLKREVHLLTQSPLRITCPADFVFNLRANICFKLYRNSKTRDDASTFCHNLPGLNTRLVVLDTQEKVQLVQEHLSAHYDPTLTQNVWIGGRQEDNEGQWLWETGQEVTGPWYPGQPNNNGGSEDCLAMGYNSLLLYDMACSLLRRYFCEY